MNKDRFLVKGLGGKRTLNGTIAVRGAKNAALPLMASSIIFSTPVTFINVPDIEDIYRMSELIKELGVLISIPKTHSIVLDPRKISSSAIHNHIAKRLRASIILTGPLLARFGKVSFPYPGGCVIGSRPIDVFIEGFKKMGATVKIKNDVYNVQAKGGKLKGADIFFTSPSPTATETFIMAAILARGKSILRNVAMEPEIKNLTDFLISAGAKIKGAGTSVIEIEGGSLLRAPKKNFTVMPDRLEAGSFLILGALSAKRLEITNCDPSNLDIVIEVLRRCGANIKTTSHSIVVSNDAKTKLKRFDSILKTHEYPGFPTDLQAPLVIFLTQAKGESIIFETIYEGRLGYTEHIVRMGADILTLDTHRVLVKGPTFLKAARLDSPDIRAGLAYVIAAIVAKGESVINNVYYIDRGYERIEERLQKIGVNIKRIKNGNKK